VFAVALAAVVTAGAVAAVPGLVLFAGTAGADAPSSIAVAQGTNCNAVAPAGDGSETVESFYDYRKPENSNETGNQTYSSWGTTEFQDTSQSSLFFYDGANGTSLVVVHDQVGDEDGGSTVTWSLSGLPAGGDLAVQDDYYENGTQDDDFDYRDGDPTADVDWKYADNRTDGAAFRGLEGAGFETIAVDPAYNEDAQYWGDWTYSGSEQYEIQAWTLRDASGDVAMELDLDQRVFVQHEDCGTGDDPEPVIDGPSNATTGETVTFDASGTTDADGNVAGYEWDFDGDGTVDATTAEPTATHSYGEPGDYTASVTAFDTYANYDSVDLEVAVLEPPNASLSAPGVVSPNETVTLDASNATDDEGIEEYRWDLDGDGVVDRNTSDSTTTTTYEETGEREPSVTVVDSDGLTDAAAATVSVEPDDPPTADLAAPEEAEVDGPVTLDASGSSDDRGIAEYRWDVDGDGEVDTTTGGDEPSTTTSYDATGNYTATVTVVDDAGQTANASATVAVVEANEPPTAELSVPETATAGESVTFDASNATDDDGIETYAWTVAANGSTVLNRTTEDPTTDYTFDDDRTYEVSVEVTDDDGASDEASASLDVEPENETVTLSAVINASAVDVGAEETVTFDGGDSTPPDAIDGYEWQFGDGETATGETVDHSYAEPGEYVVELTVTGTDDDNETVTDTTTLEVTVSEGDDDDDDEDDGGNNGNQGGGNGDNNGGGDDNQGGGNGNNNAGGNGNNNGGGNDNNAGSGDNDGGNGNDGQSNSGGFRGGTDDDEDEPEPEPEFEVGGLNVTDADLLAGQNATFAVDVANTGNASGATNVTFSLNGDVLATETVTLDAGERTTVSVSHQFETAGAYEVTAEGAGRVEVDVTPADPRLSVTEVAASADEVASGDRFRVNATVRNDGGRVGSTDVELELFGEVVAVETVSVPPGETRTVSFSRRLIEPGTYTASVAGRSVTVTVADDDTATTTQSRDAPATVPGFTLEAALVASLIALAGAALARREQ